MLEPKQLVVYGLNAAAVAVIFVLHFGYAKQLSPEYGEPASMAAIVACFMAAAFAPRFFR